MNSKIHYTLKLAPSSCKLHLHYLKCESNIDVKTIINVQTKYTRDITIYLVACLPWSLLSSQLEVCLTQF